MDNLFTAHPWFYVREAYIHPHCDRWISAGPSGNIPNTLAVKLHAANGRWVAFDRIFVRTRIAFPGLTTRSDDRIMQGMRYTLYLVLLLCAACAMQPPAQEMSDARSAIKTAQQLPGGDTSKADRYLQSAEEALNEAAEAMRVEEYDRARNKALEARRNAQEAARIKQQNK